MKKIIIATDYHYFPEVASIVNMYGNYKSKVRVFEVGFSAGGYVGMLYTGKKPTQKSVSKMLDSLNIKLL